MINKQEFEEIEKLLDEYAKQRSLNSSNAKPVIDKYFDLIIQFFEEINEIETIDFKLLDQYPVVPMNFEERYRYMLARKYHFMGYSQMKTLKSELLKMNASYQIRRKRQS